MCTCAQIVATARQLELESGVEFAIAFIHVHCCIHSQIPQIDLFFVEFDDDNNFKSKEKKKNIAHSAAVIV